MSVTKLSSSSQNYLKAIWSLGEWSNEPVTASTLAAKVGVRLSSASDAIKKLTDQGLLEHTRYGSVALSPTGLKYALEMVRRHRLIETFLVESLGYRWDQVHDEAEQLEHAVSDFMVDRMDQQLGYPVKDPHGDPIPSADGSLNHPDAVLLTEAPKNVLLTVERISDADPALLQFLAGQQVGVGTRLWVRPGPPFSESVEAIVHTDPQDEDPQHDSEHGVVLGRTATDSVWVTVHGADAAH